LYWNQLHCERVDMSEQIQRALAEMESATAGLTDADLLRLRLAEGKWSAAETIEHLVLTFTSTTKLMRRVAQKPATVPAANFRQRIASFIVVGIGHMPARRKSPDFACPSGTPAPAICERFRQLIHAMDSAITEAEKRSTAGTKIAAHPVLGPLTASQWRKFHLVHTRHHMKQVRAMRASGKKGARNESA
jgi:hypothetical protein